MESQRAIKLKGGTMRLGSYDCEISTGTKHTLFIVKRLLVKDIDIDLK